MVRPQPLPIDWHRRCRASYCTSNRRIRRFGETLGVDGGVVLWHIFNLIGFGPVDFQTCHSDYDFVRPGRLESISSLSTFPAGLPPAANLIRTSKGAR